MQIITKWLLFESRIGADRSLMPLVFFSLAPFSMLFSNADLSGITICLLLIKAIENKESKEIKKLGKMV
jgi:hypothetical protein